MPRRRVAGLGIAKHSSGYVLSRVVGEGVSGLLARLPAGARLSARSSDADNGLVARVGLGLEGG